MADALDILGIKQEQSNQPGQGQTARDILNMMPEANPAVAQAPASGINRLAQMPAQALDPYTGGWASTLLPTTPAGWGAAAGLAAAAPFTGGGSLAPWVARAGMAAIGAGTGAFMGGATPAQAGAQGTLTGLGQALIAEPLAAGAGKAVEIGKKIVGTTINPYWQKIADKVADILPGVKTAKADSQWFINVFRGGEGDKVAGATFGAGIETIKNRLPPNAFVQSPVMTQIVKDNVKNLVSADDALDLRVAGQILNQAGIKAPAHVVLQRGQPMTIDTAVKLASELTENAMSLPSGAEKRAALVSAERFKKALQDQLNNFDPKMGMGNFYKDLTTDYWRWKSIARAVEEDGDKIFRPGGKVDTPALAYAVNNKALAKMREVPGGAEFASAVARGAPGGGGDVHHRIPFSAYLFGRTRVADPGLNIVIPAGAPPGRVAGALTSPTLFGYPIGQATTGPGAKFIDTIFPPDEQK